MKTMLFTLMAMLVYPVIAHAQLNPTLFDLGGPTSSVTTTVNSGDPIDVTIINFLPKKNLADYTINAVREPITPPVLVLPTTTANGQESAQFTSNPCIAAYATKLDAASIATEKDFAGLMANAKTACNDFYQAEYNATTFINNYGTLNNESLTITIVNTVSHKTWTLIFKTEQDGQFLTLYGFSFIPHVFTHSHTYYAIPNTGKIGTYYITRSTSESLADYAPTVSFHYVSTKHQAISSSLTAGVGAAFNTSENTSVSPVVFLGYSFLYHQNFGFNIGIASDLVSKLKGQYKDGQLITTNLESSDLTEKTIGFNPFFSVIFRFGSSPFTVKKANAPATPAKPTSTGL